MPLICIWEIHKLEPFPPQTIRIAFIAVRAFFRDSQVVSREKPLRSVPRKTPIHGWIPVRTGKEFLSLYYHVLFISADDVPQNKLYLLIRPYRSSHRPRLTSTLHFDHNLKTFQPSRCVTNTPADTGHADASTVQASNTAKMSWTKCEKQSQPTYTKSDPRTVRNSSFSFLGASYLFARSIWNSSWKPRDMIGIMEVS